MEYPLPDFLDRFAIVIVKMGHTDEVVDEFTVMEVEFSKLAQTKPELRGFLDQLVRIHTQIWEYEYNLRRGAIQKYEITEEILGMKLSQLQQLAAVGLNAIKIRDTNRERKRIQNQIIDMWGEGFKDIKVNHASE